MRGKTGILAKHNGHHTATSKLLKLKMIITLIQFYPLDLKFSGMFVVMLRFHMNRVRKLFKKIPQSGYVP